LAECFEGLKLDLLSDKDPDQLIADARGYLKKAFDPANPATALNDPVVLDSLRIYHQAISDQIADKTKPL